MKSEAKLLENIVAINLYKAYGDRLFYYNRTIEVDYYVPSESLAIQVAYDITDAATRQRELSALIKLNKHEPTRQLLVITYNDEETIDIDGVTIRVVPVWKFVTDNIGKCSIVSKTT